MQGKEFGRYHILEPLGEGGMADVYKAFDTHLEIEVAVKVIRIDELPPKILARTLKRFEREAKSLARLNHPNIVNVTDYGEFEGQPFLVMPYLQGGTLKEMLQGKAMGWQEAAQLLIPITKALGYAHQREMVHRDVKPSNILITETGEPLLTDFGVAKIIDDEATMDLTGTHATVGTPEYMAPEQVTAKTVDHRADIYSLGVVFYEMVTGRKPFQADTPMAVLFKHASDPLPRPTQFVPKLPKEVEQILLKALAKDPGNRYQSMDEMVLALEKLLQGKSSAPLSQNSKGISKKKASRDESSISKTPFPTQYLWFVLGGAAVVSILLGWMLGGGKPAAFITTSTSTGTLTPTPTFTPTVTSIPISIYLSEIKPRTTTVGYGDFSIGEYSFTSTDASDKVKKGDSIIAHGIQYPHGLFAHAPSKLTYELNKQYSELRVSTVLVDWIQCGDGAVFVILLDDQEIYRSKRMFYSSPPVDVKIDITDGNQLELIIEKGSDLDCDWTIWGDPILH
jgi:serine/threonine protein kinase